MPKIRSRHIHKIHKEFVFLTKSWTPDKKEGSLPNYLIQHGIEHMFKIKDIESVRKQLLNLYFFHEMYEAKNWAQILKYWRKLGDENVGNDYLKSVKSALKGNITESLLISIGSVGNFCESCY